MFCYIICRRELDFWWKIDFYENDKHDHHFKANVPMVMFMLQDFQILLKLLFLNFWWMSEWMNESAVI